MKVVGSMRTNDKSRPNILTRNLLLRFDGVGMSRDQWTRPDTDLFIQWGFKPTLALRSVIRQKIPFVILDLGYFDPHRTKVHSISINGLHGLSMPPDTLSLPPRPKPALQPWQLDRGDKVIVYGQMPRDQALRGIDIDAWMHKAAVDAAQTFGKPAHKRPHPKMINPWEPALEPLQDTFEDTYVAVSLTSAAAIQSVIAGVPTIAMHPASAAFKVTATTMKRMTYDRGDWLHDLSHRQYNLRKDSDLDAAAEHILRNYPRALDAAREGRIDKEGIRV